MNPRVSPLLNALARCSALGLLAAGLAAPAAAAEKFSFLTSWYAQAEHGGYYQAQARGLYRDAGLEVTIKPGGPQINAIQILAAGQADCIMGSSDPQVLKAREQGVPIVHVAAIFQKDPQGLVAHPHVKRLEDVKGRTVMIGTAARSTYWPWLRATYGFSDDQTRPYAYSLQPFIADRELVVQGYVTYDPYAMKQAGAESNFFLFSDHGWPVYANTLACHEKVLAERPQALAAFLKASLEGWKSYMAAGTDRGAANALIKKDNPQMTDGQMEFAFNTMRDRGMVTGGDVAKEGIGTLSPERLKKTYDFFVSQKLLDPAKVDFARTYDTRFIKAAKVLPEARPMSIPVIDLAGALTPGAAGSRAAARALQAAASGSGFFYAVGHGVPAHEVDAMFELTRRFFELPQADKEAIGLDKGKGTRGYEGIGAQTLDADAQPDLKESFYCGLDHPADHPYVVKGYAAYGASLWPEQLPQLRAAGIAYTLRLQALAQRIMQLMALSLDLEESFFDATFGHPGMTLRLVRYPPHPRDAGEHTFGAGAHTDWGAITILAQDSLGGLEVQMPDGSWVAATPLAGSFVVNLGDMIPRWTNGRYHSNPHRVRNLHGNGQPRHSIPFFYTPDHEARVEPIASCIPAGTDALYAPCTVGEHMQEMYRRTYARA